MRHRSGLRENRGKPECGAPIDARPPSVKIAQSERTLLAMALSAVADALLECGQQIEGHVRGLEAPRIGVRQIVH